MPNINRHCAENIGNRTRVKETNTIYSRKMKPIIERDLQLINSGKASKQGEFWKIEDRVYTRHNDSLVPVSGEEFYTLSRSEFKAFVKFCRCDEPYEAIKKLNFDPSVTNSNIELASEIYFKVFNVKIKLDFKK